MKIRRLICATTLTLVLSCSTLAGDTWVPGITDPPPPGQGREANIGSPIEASDLDTLTNTAMLLCQSMLSLF